MSEHPVFPIGARVIVRGVYSAPTGGVVVDHQDRDAWDCPSGRKFTVTWHQVTRDSDGVTYWPAPDLITAE